MKLSSVSVLLIASLVASGAWARDITTTTGEVYHNAVVTKTQPDGVRVVHDDGAGFIDFQILSEADRKEFGYDPAAYAAAGKDEAALEKRRKELQFLAARQALYLAGKAAEATIAAGGPSPYDAPAPAPPNRWPTTIDVSLQTPDFSYGDYGSSGWISWPYVPSTYVTSPAYVTRYPRRQTTVIVNSGVGSNFRVGPISAVNQPAAFRAPSQSTGFSFPTQTTTGTTFGGRFGGASSIPSAASRR